MQSLDMLSDDPKDSNTVVFGEVIGVHVDDQVLVNGKIDFLKVRPIGRLGYFDFVEVNNIFSMARPDWDAE